MSLTLFCSHSSHIAHLEAEIDWLRTQMLKERQRAERAIDELLRLGANAQPVSVPLIHDEPPPRDPLAIFNDQEFARVGE